MRASRLAIICGIALLTAASAGPCYYAASLHAVFEERDLLVEPALLGTWIRMEDGDTVRWTFATGDSGTKTYRLTFRYRDAEAKFVAGLGRIGDRLFLDVRPGDDTYARPGFEFFLIPVHLVTRVWLDQDTLHYAPIDGDWLRRTVTADPGAVRHDTLSFETDGHTIVYLLTAPPPELRAFLHTRATDTPAFRDRETLRRRPP